MKIVFIFICSLWIFITGCKKETSSQVFTTPLSEIAGIRLCDKNNSNYGRVSWCKPGSFYLDNFGSGCISIGDMGAIEKLDDITQIPSSLKFSVPNDINTSVACETGHGYVIKMTQEEKILFARLYVIDSISDSNGKCRGVKIQYQCPFEAQ